MLRAVRATFSPHVLGLLFVVVGIGLPLFTGLGRWDMGNDEAIYSYSVERILETDEWLTPRSIPSDQPFFEKPPLKFWIVAGAMKAGLVPPGDTGMRVFDALFGAMAFVYVYLLGVRLAGPLCGVCAAMILFAFSPLVFEHGLRGNNMEAPLVLAYAGGVFHLIRWVQRDDGQRRWDATWVALFFVLGFMTKFVAVLFLPLVGVAAVAVHPQAVRLVRQRWREWILPTVLAIVLIAPWFVYQTLQPSGPYFWEVLLGLHVYQRLAGVLIPEHLQPWHHYVTATWREFRYAEAVAVVTAGIAALAYTGWWRGNWIARTVLLWFVVPYGVISLGTSKLLHYAYPFIPPLALGGGLLCALAFRAFTAGRLPLSADRADRLLTRFARWRERPVVRTALLCLGGALAVLALATAVQGPLTIESGGLRWFRNSSVVRPLALAALCVGFTADATRFRAALAAALLLLALPVDRYVENVRWTTSVRHPLRAIRDCVVEVQRDHPDLPRGVIRATGEILHHSYYFYMRHTGAWRVINPPDHDVPLREAIANVPSAALLTRRDARALAARTGVSTPAVLVEPEIAFLLPGPYTSCIPVALSAGAQPLGLHGSAGAAVR